MENIFLHTLAKAKLYKKVGMSRVLCGVEQENGKAHPDEPNLARDLRELGTDGRLIEIPDDIHGGSKTVRLKVYHIVSSCDYLGAMSLLPNAESPGSHFFCRGCYVNAADPDCHRPFSFLRTQQAGKRKISERKWPELKKVIAKLRRGEGDRKKLMHDHGLNKLYFALDPAYWDKHVDPTTIAPIDLLHLFPDGLLRSELAWMLFIFMKMGLKIETINKRVRAYSKQSPTFPKDVRIPEFKAKLSKGITGGVPNSSSTVNMTGSQCMHFSVHR